MKWLKPVALSALGAALFYAFVTVAPVVRAGVACSVPFVFVNGQPADANQVNSNFNSLVSCFSSAAGAGVNTDITALNALTTPITPAQGGTQYFWGGTSTGSANAYVVTTVTPTSGFSLSAGVIVTFISNFANTPAAAGTVTLNVNGSGAKPIGRQTRIASGIAASQNLVGGELLGTNSVVQVQYTGTTWLIVNGDVSRIGEVMDYGAAGCPTGWLEANGAAFSTTNFSDLNAVLGSTWTAGTLPDLRGRLVAGRDSGGSGRITAAGGNFDGTVVGNTGGGQNQTLTIAQLPIFSNSFSLNSSNIVQQQGGSFSGTTEFTVSASGDTAPTLTGVGRQWGVITPNTTVSFGSGNAHTILSPAGIVTKCVKL